MGETLAEFLTDRLEDCEGSGGRDASRLAVDAVLACMRPEYVVVLAEVEARRQASHYRAALEAIADSPVDSSARRLAKAAIA